MGGGGYDIDEIYINFELLHDICINFLHYNEFHTTLNTSGYENALYSYWLK